MKNKFLITSIESGRVMAREKNPHEDMPIVDVAMYSEAEDSLKTYPLSEESINDMKHWPLRIDQEILGEVINNQIVIN